MTRSSPVERAVLADEAADRTVVRRDRRFDGQIWSVRTDRVELGDGQRVDRDVLSHPGAVGIVAIDGQLRILMVQQYRHPVGALLWEPPAGLLDVVGEDPLDAAARELFEEAGYRARRWEVLVDAFTSPGGSDEAVRIYLARDLTEVPSSERFVGNGEERNMPISWTPLAQARDAVLGGQLHSPLAVMGVLAAASVLLDGVVGPRQSGAAWFRPRGVVPS